MKRHVGQFKVGDVVLARIVEATGGRDFIIEFEGDLIRIANQSGTPFQQGQMVELLVTTIKPFSFRLCHTSKAHFDRRV